MARRDILGQSALQPDATTNLSLWLDRYTWGFDQAVLRQHHGVALDRIRVPEGYRRAFERRNDALKELGGDFPEGETRFYDVVLLGRAVVGIGMASVRETNLSLLRPWGVPFLPGSALKGLASHVAHAAGGEWARPVEPGERAGELQQAIFGDVASSGAVVFHDAWWQPGGERVPVSADAMTVHHAGYYQGESAPADWDEPNPVSFLTAHDRYLAALTGPSQALDIAEALLRRGLSERGIGAKTAAGYGRADFKRHFSEIAAGLRDYSPGPVAANNVQQQAQAFLRLAGQARSPEEAREAREAARRLSAASPVVWKKWLESPARTEEERRWFDVASIEVSNQPAPAPSLPVEAPSVVVERRRVRVRFIPDKKATARFFLRIEGEPKDIKGHLVAISAEDLERVRSAGGEGAEVDLEYEGGKPRRPTGGQGS